MLVEGLVSTIIPVYNRAAMLREAVASVLAQDYRPIEVIIVNDGSTDDTQQVVEALQAAEPDVVRALQIANAGPGAAREAGRRVACGSFIQYLDSDDVLLERKFSLQTAALKANQGAHVAYGKTRFRHADGRIEPGAWKGSGDVVAAMFPSFLMSRWWDTPNPLYRRSICDQAGAWLTTRCEEDWEYDCRIAALGARLVHVPEFVCEVRDHAEQRLSRGSLRDKKRMADRAAAHKLIHAHARQAGIPRDASQMQHFARELFLLARQCGAAGLGDAAEELFLLARQSSTETRVNGLDFRLYSWVATCLGWDRAGRLACAFDQVRSR